MKAEDIVDIASCLAWLDGQKPDVRSLQSLMNRFVLRVMPAQWPKRGAIDGSDYDTTLLAYFRLFNLAEIAFEEGVSEQYDTVIKTALERVNNEIGTHLRRVGLVGGMALEIGIVLSVAVSKESEKISQDVVQMIDPISRAPEFWREVALDCAEIERGKEPSKEALWRATPSPWAETWAQIAQTERSRAATSGDEMARGGGQLDWTFWVDWYEDVLAGRPRNIPMMEEIALEVDWDREPDLVLAQIEGIRGKYAAAASPNAETVLQDPEDQKFYSEPDTDLPRDDIQDVIDRLNDAVADVLGVKPEANYCIATLLDEHTRKVSDVVERYGHRPLKLYEVCIDVTIAVEARIVEGELSARDRHLAEFMRQLERSSTDILNDDPEVAKKVRARGYVRISKLNEDEKNHVRLLAEQGAAESKPEFAEELEAAAKVVTDDDAEEKERTDAGYELGSRLTRMEKIRRDTVGAADDVSKLGKGGGAVWELITTVYSWFV